MIFIDPSELREKIGPQKKPSRLLRYLSDVVYKPLPGLEALTGADVMISPSQSPSPLNEALILANIRGGAKLLQLKFGHDLPSSVVDGRLDEALSRMQATDANPWQCCLLFIGLLGHDDTKGMATVNGQLTYGDYPLSWDRIDQCLGLWIDQGGALEMPLASGKQIINRFSNIQTRIDKYTQRDTKYIYPNFPMTFEEIESDNPVLKKWGVGRKLVRVEDLRQLIKAIPDAQIGHERATAIFEWMAENEIRQDLNGFLGALKRGWLQKVPGIGPKTEEAIRQGLFTTLEERNDRNEKFK